MFERFTDRARKVMALANQEAQRTNHEYIDTGHVLIAAVREGGGHAFTALANLGVGLPQVVAEVGKLMPVVAAAITMGKLPQTPRTKKAIEYAIEESQKLGHEHVGTEHLLLGLVRETEGVAYAALNTLGVTPEKVREEVMRLLAMQKSADPQKDEIMKSLTYIVQQIQPDPKAKAIDIVLDRFTRAILNGHTMGQFQDAGGVRELMELRKTMKAGATWEVSTSAEKLV